MNAQISIHLKTSGTPPMRFDKAGSTRYVTIGGQGQAAVVVFFATDEQFADFVQALIDVAS